MKYMTLLAFISGVTLEALIPLPLNPVARASLFGLGAAISRCTSASGHQSGKQCEKSVTALGGFQSINQWPIPRAQ